MSSADRMIKVFLKKLLNFSSLNSEGDRKNGISNDADSMLLPEKHRFAHQYCLMIHDCLAQTVVEGVKANVFNVSVIDEDGGLLKKLQSAEGRDIIQILEEEGRFVEVFLLLYRQVTVAILSDMCHFIFEALNCSQKGKLTVTFHLLRKPLVENLLYLEYLLADPGSFIFNFWKGEIDHFGLGQNQTLDPKEIIKKIYTLYPLPQFEDAEFIHEIRYDKESDQSFQTFFQKSTHLVTQRRTHKTENTNFNFIYSTASDIESQWTGLYSYLPIVMFHGYQVVEALLKLVGRRAADELDITDHRINVGYALWEKFSSWGNFGELNNLDRLIEIHDLSSYTCARCKSPIPTSFKNYQLFYEAGCLLCPECDHSTNLVIPFLRQAEKERSSNKRDHNW